MFFSTKKKIIKIIIILLLINTGVFADRLKSKNFHLDLYMNEDNHELNALLKKHAIKINQYLKEYADNDLDYLANETALSFTKFLQSIGYLSTQVKCQANQVGHANHIRCDINPGAVFLLEGARIVLIPLTNNKNIKIPEIKEMPLEMSSPVDAKKILQAQSRIDEFMEANNCLFDLSTSHTLLIDKSKNTAIINYNIRYGEVAYIKNITFTGLTKTKPYYALHLAELNCQSCFTKSKLNLAKNNLNKSGILAVTDIILPTSPNEDGGVDVDFHVIEQKTKTTKIGIKYTSDFGMAIDTGLINRNLFGTGKKLTNEVTFSKKLKSIDNSYTDSYFLRQNQKFFLQNIFKQEQIEAYSNREFSLTSSLEREIIPKLTGGFGIKYSISKVSEDLISNKNRFFSFPLFLVYDYRDNITDPQYGFVTKVEITPYISVSKNNINFFKSRISGAVYLPVSKDKNVIIALRGNIGSINKIKLTGIPINERFFAGGSNSIRGYKYQTAGPLINNKKPIGGTSVVDFSTELRYKINEDYGAVLFMDMGNVFHSKLPFKFKNNLFVSAGMGLRYYTNFGPIRADIAFPLTKKRHKIDNLFQIYFSIGQTF